MKDIRWKLLLVMAFPLLAAGAGAQGPGGPPPGMDGPPPGMGGFSLPPAMQAKIKAWQQWRSSHKNVVSLQQTLDALTEMEQGPRTVLTKPQARTILAVLKKWQGKAALTDDQARLVNMQLTRPLALIQLKKIAAMAQGRRGGFGGPGGRPPGGLPPGAAPPPMNPASFPAPRDYNPLNPATQPIAPMRERAGRQHARLMAALLARAK